MKYKVGDKVKIVSLQSVGRGCCIDGVGDVGEIIEYDSSDLLEYRVKIEYGGRWWWEESNLELIEDADLMHSDQMTNEDVQNETTIISGYSSFLAEVNDLVKLNKSYGEQLVTQMENEHLRKIPKLSDNKKFLGRLRATRLLIYKN